MSFYNSLRLNTGHIRTLHLGFMMSMVQDPIQCGYLLDFSTQEHNSENLCFIIMVSRFRDVVCRDYESWPKTWIDVDKEMDGLDTNEIAANSCWPSTKLSKSNIEKMMNSIWDEFLSDNAPTQIFMPAKVVKNTQRRMLLLDFYGPDVFAEALLDPIETINQDILPRFIFSYNKMDMDKRVQLLKKEIDMSSIQNHSPKDNPLLKLRKEQFNEKRKFSLHEIMNNSILYNEFYDYLKAKALERNLLCLRMIIVFDDLWLTNTSTAAVNESSESFEKVKDYAWLIYRYFIIKDAPYEFSLHSRYKKEIMVSLASADQQIFDQLKKSVTAALTTNFNIFKATDRYRDSWKLMKSEQGKSAWSMLYRIMN